MNVGHDGRVRSDELQRLDVIYYQIGRLAVVRCDMARTTGGAPNTGGLLCWRVRTDSIIYSRRENRQGNADGQTPAWSGYKGRPKRHERRAI